MLCQLTTLAIRNFLPLSLPAQNLPLSQIFPTTDSLLASGLTPRLYDYTVSSEHLHFLFLVLFISLLVFLVLCGRLNWLPVSFWTHINIVYHHFLSPAGVTVL